MEGSGGTIKPAPGSRPHLAIAASISAELRTGSATTSTANFRAADAADSESRGEPGLSGLIKTAMRVRRGAMSLSSSRSFAPTLVSKVVNR